MSTLDRILDEAWRYRQEGRRFLAVFDLDSTLLDLTTRITLIVSAIAEDAAMQTLFPEETSKLKNLEYGTRDWGFEEPLSRLQITPEKNGAFIKELYRRWATAFFSNDYLHCDTPLPGAVDFVKELHQIGAHVTYLTARDTERMGPGTVKSLEACGFPLHHPGVELILKKTPAGDDAQFKVDVLVDAQTRFEKIWLFENEPVNLNLVAKHCPEIELVFIDSTHSRQEEVSETLARIEHFEVDLNEFRKRF